MPGRLLPLVTGEIYHVYNRGINHQPTFITKRENNRFLQTLRFYRYSDTPLRLSKFLLLNAERQGEIIKNLEISKRLVEILAYCFMPNHFHLLLKQEEEAGIAKFLGKLLNSYTKYFNTLNQRDGSVFLDQFKAVRIETDEQLIHVSRYIHLNPYTGYVVKNLDTLETYTYSSLKNYITSDKGFVSVELILKLFKDKDAYKHFVFDQAEYQRKLDEIKHLVLE